MEQKTLGESKAGRHSQSMVPSVPTRAAVCRSPMIPWSSIGRYPTCHPIDAGSTTCALHSASAGRGWQSPSSRSTATGYTQVGEASSIPARIVEEQGLSGGTLAAPDGTILVQETGAEWDERDAPIPPELASPPGCLPGGRPVEARLGPDEVFVDQLDGVGSRSYRRGDPLHRAVPHVACGEDAGYA